MQAAAENLLTNHLNKDVKIKHSRPVGGGCINETVIIETGSGSFFLKWNSADRYPGMFEAEARGLRLLADAEAIHVPGVITHGRGGQNAFIILEHIIPAARKPQVLGTFWSFPGSLA